MIYIDNKGDLKITNDPQDIVFESCIQELRLWKGEKDINVEEGVDYRSVFEQAAFLKVELQNVVNRHAKNFASVEIGEPTMGEDEVIKISIVFHMLDGTSRIEEIVAKVGE